jgi:hypothetical protein
MNSLAVCGDRPSNNPIQLPVWAVTVRAKNSS